MKVVFCNCTQCYPKKFSASNTKMEFMARGLMENGTQVAVLNEIVGEANLRNVEEGNNKGIKYYIFSQCGNKIVSYLKNIKKMIAVLGKERRNHDTNILFCGGIFPTFAMQVIFGKLLGYKCVLLIQEWNSAFKDASLLHRWSSWAICHFWGYFLDGIMPISHFLEDKMKHFGKPMHIVPVLSEYGIGKNECCPDKVQYFSYCASAAYFRVVKMMLDAFKIYLENGGTCKLVFIISGKESDIRKVKEYVREVKIADFVIFKQQIPYSELIETYESSLGLLIPLDPNSLADIARFSQKIAEYVSTCRPIITSNVGEIPYYFKDKENAIICEYSDKSYADAMLLLQNDRTLANVVGRKGYEVGLNKFDYQVNGIALFHFLNSL